MSLSDFEEGLRNEPTEEERLASLEYAQDRKRHAILAVEDRASFLETIAGNALEETQILLDSIRDDALAYTNPSTSSIDNINTSIGTSISYSNRPDLLSLNSLPQVSLPRFGGSYIEEDIGTLPDINALFPVLPPVNVSVSSFNAPTRPPLLPYTSPPDAYTPQNISVSSAPIIRLPTAPSIGSFQAVEFSSVSIPSFNEVLESFDVRVPGTFSWTGESYKSDFYGDLLLSVLKGIRSGGVSLGAKIEEEIFARHKSRVFDENEKLMTEAEDYFAGRGFTMPSGILLSKLTELSRSAARANADASRDIAVSQAELLHKSNEFYLSLGKELESVIRQFYSENMNRSLDAQKTVVGTGIEIAKILHDAARIKVERFNAKATAWAGNLQLKVVNAEEYKLKIEASMLSNENKKLLNDNYATQVSAAKIAAEIFTEQVRAASITAEIEKLKTEMSVLRLEQHSKRTEENMNRIKLFESSISAEKAKLEASATEVAAKSARSEAIERQIKSLISQKELILAKNKTKFDRFNAEIALHMETISKLEAEHGSQLDAYKALCSAYGAETDRDKAYYEILNDEVRAKIEVETLKLQKAVSQVDAAIKGFQSVSELKLSAEQGMMQVTAQLAASAMQGISSHSSMTYSGGDSFSSTEATSYSSIKQVSTTI